MRSKTISLFAVGLCALILSALALSACGGDDKTSAPVVSDAWARVTAPSQDKGAIYMTIESPAADKLVAASVPTSVAGRTELHETVATGSESSSMDGGEMKEDEMKDGEMAGGAMEMRQVDGIAIPAGQPVQLKPGGYHIMLFDLAEPIVAGQKIQVALDFEKAGAKTVIVEAREG